MSATPVACVKRREPGVPLAPLCAQQLTESQELEIRSITRLTPGDFRNVYQVHSLTERSQVTHESLIAALRREVQAKAGGGGRKMGLV